jgi:hypothetical protein
MAPPSRVVANTMVGAMACQVVSRSLQRQRVMARRHGRRKHDGGGDGLASGQLFVAVVNRRCGGKGDKSPSLS